ncbi:MAG: RIP metalloprotease RseP [Proteobacteria bacterium]|nr:RIP metalloprotease RseP [Pseudomonadota bacterium]
MELLNIFTHNLLSFIIILSVIVFVHEFGHYWVARRCGVRVEEFAIGFGKEIFGINDSHGTRWKFCVLPFGGYVKMFGDQNPASVADQEKIKEMTAEEKKVSFFFQNVYKRMAIVTAGPAANFILTILLFTIIFRYQGIATTLPIVSQVVENGAAIEAGIQEGDLITRIGEKEIENFDQVKQEISINKGEAVEILVQRDGEEILFNLTPKISESKDFFGNEIKVAMIGVAASEVKYEKFNLIGAFIEANKRTYDFSIAIFSALGDLITGKRSVKELGGPIKIAQYSGQSVDMGFVVVLWFMAMISVNLGVINLLPLPVLDGGHLFFYIIEAIRGKALPERVQQYGFQLGFVLIISLMVFTVYNDIAQIFIK